MIHRSMKLPSLPLPPALAKFTGLPAPMGKLVLTSAMALTATLGATAYVAITYGHKDQGTQEAQGHGGSASETASHDSPIGHLQEPVTVDQEPMEQGHGNPGHGDHGAAAPNQTHGDPGHGSHDAAAPNPPHDEHGQDAQADAHNSSHADAHGKSQGHEKADHADDSPHSEAGHGDAHAQPGSGEEGDLLRQLVTEYAQSGQVSKAFPFLIKALAKGPQPPEFLTIAARLMMANGQWDKAQALAEQAQAKLPNREDMGVLAMMATYRQGKIEEAMAQAMTLLQKQPRNVELLTALGTMHSEQHPDDATADGFLKQALVVNPTYIPAIYQVGRRFMHAKQYPAAQKTFEQILSLQPGYPKAFAQLGMSLYYQEQFEEARQKLISALKASPRDYNTWYNLGEVYLQQAAEAGVKDTSVVAAIRQRAFSCYNQAIELQPRHAMAHYRMGLILQGNNQSKEATRHFEFALEIMPELVPGWLQLALAYENLQLYDKARAALDKAYALDPLNKVVALKLREWG
jgi:tetratricopeptide (TPR) repeat protein